jgi:hypothetical protein
MNATVELVLKHKKANMRKSDFLMLEALKSAPHLNDKYSTPSAKSFSSELPPPYRIAITPQTSRQIAELQ